MPKRTSHAFFLFYFPGQSSRHSKQRSSRKLRSSSAADVCAVGGTEGVRIILEKFLRELLHDAVDLLCLRWIRWLRSTQTFRLQKIETAFPEIRKLSQAELRTSPGRRNSARNLCCVHSLRRRADQFSFSLLARDGQQVFILERKK